MHNTIVYSHSVHLLIKKNYISKKAYLTIPRTEIVNYRVAYLRQIVLFLISTPFMYWFEDVIRLETEYPELKSSASNIVDVSELEQRWRKSGEELFEDIENAGLCPVNPVGVEPDPDELFDLINYRKCITPCDLLYGKSEVKNAEIEFEIEHFEKVQQADPIRIAAGHNIADVYRQLGHASINITVDTYYHWLPNQNSSQVSKLDDLGKERNHPQPTRNHKEKGIPAIAATP